MPNRAVAFSTRPRSIQFDRPVGRVAITISSAGKLASVFDRQQPVGVADLAAGDDAAPAQGGDREIEALLCARQRLVDIRDPLARA
jgi:hypothetical protein